MNPFDEGNMIIKYSDCKADGEINDDEATIYVNDIVEKDREAVFMRKGETILLRTNDGLYSDKAIVTSVDNVLRRFNVAFYAQDGQPFEKGVSLSVFVINGDSEEVQVFRNSAIITQDKYKVYGSDACYGTTTNYAKEESVELEFIREIFLEGIQRDTEESPSNFSDIRLLTSPFKYWYKREKVCLFSAWNKEGETPRLFLGRIKHVSEK